MTFNDILYDVQDKIATITLNRPDKLNAARPETQVEIRSALDEADNDESVRVVICTGAGRAFCSGTDISGGFIKRSRGNSETGEGVSPDLGGPTALRVYGMQKPVIAAINGPAVGFGASFTLPMDYRIASTSAKFSFPFARRGISAESCSSWFLPRLVGIDQALNWMLSGRTFSAEEALAKGLVSELTAPETLLQRAREIACEIAVHTAPASIAVNRQLLWRMLGADHPKIAHDLESRAVAAGISMPDSEEGTLSFKEKRLPRFTGTTRDAAYVKAWWKDT